mgnify:CR=1 FL=1
MLSRGSRRRSKNRSALGRGENPPASAARVDGALAQNDDTTVSPFCAAGAASGRRLLMVADNDDVAGSRPPAGDADASGYPADPRKGIGLSEGES